MAKRTKKVATRPYRDYERAQRLWRDYYDNGIGYKVLARREGLSYSRVRDIIWREDQRQEALRQVGKPAPDTPVDMLSRTGMLSTRLYNVLRGANVKKLADLAKLSADELGDLPNLGERSLHELRKLCQSVGAKPRQEAA